MLSSQLPQRLGLGIDFDYDPIVGTIDVIPELCGAAGIRASMLMLLADLAAGIPDDMDDPGAWHLTTDFSLRTFTHPEEGRIAARATSLRRGATSTAAEVHMVDADSRRVAYAQIGFARRPVGPDDPTKPDPASIPERTRRRPPVIERPLVEEAGIEVVDGPKGHVLVELTEALRNPAGVMQGAMVALVAEVAAEALAADTCGEPQVVRDMDIRYLMGGRDGPITSEGTWLRDPADGWIGVELRDAGRGGRLMTSVMARCVPARTAPLP